MSDKVVLTQEQAKLLKDYTDMWTDEKIIESLIHAKENGATDEEEKVLIQLSTDTLIRALYIGYEVEQTPEEQLLQYYKVQKNSVSDEQERTEVAIVRVLEFLEIKVKGINA